MQAPFVLYRLRCTMLLHRVVQSKLSHMQMVAQTKNLAQTGTNTGPQHKGHQTHPVQGFDMCYRPRRLAAAHRLCKNDSTHLPPHWRLAACWPACRRHPKPSPPSVHPCPKASPSASPCCLYSPQISTRYPKKRDRPGETDRRHTHTNTDSASCASPKRGGHFSAARRSRSLDPALANKPVHVFAQGHRGACALLCDSACKMCRLSARELSKQCLYMHAWSGRQTRTTATTCASPRHDAPCHAMLASAAKEPPTSRAHSTHSTRC